jgi:hypothetical protein
LKFTDKHINEKSTAHMRQYLQRVWAMIAPSNTESTPLMHKHRDLEAYGHSDSDTVILVCDPPDAPLPPHTHTHTPARLSPFSEFHFPLYPLQPASSA